MLNMILCGKTQQHMGGDSLNSHLILGNDSHLIWLLFFFAWLKFVLTEVTELCFVCISYKFNLLSSASRTNKMPCPIVQAQETEQSNIVLFHYSKMPLTSRDEDILGKYEVHLEIHSSPRINKEKKCFDVGQEVSFTVESHGKSSTGGWLLWFIQISSAFLFTLLFFPLCPWNRPKLPLTTKNTG